MIRLNEIPGFLKRHREKLKDGLRMRLKLKVGTRIQASDREYIIGIDGALRRVSPKPWRNKREMKAWKRQRRAAR